MARTKQTARKRPRLALVIGSAELPPLPGGVGGLMMKLFSPCYATKEKGPFIGRFGQCLPSTLAADDCKKAAETGGEEGRQQQQLAAADFVLVWTNLYDDISSYLAPHEVLSVLRASNGTWSGNFRPGERKRIMLRSVFAYFNISQEAAHAVEEITEGGWKAFAPVMVQIGRYLVENVYGNSLEPEPAHRAVIAEQACFWKRRRSGEWESEGRRAGRLLGHDYYREYSFLLEGEEEQEEDVEKKNKKQRLPALDELKQVKSREICWGDVDPCLVSYTGDAMKTWLGGNRKWMVEHSDQLITHRDNGDDNSEMTGDNVPDDDGKQSTMRTYKNRLDQGLHPPIWIMYDTGSEPVEWALCFGRDREHFVTSMSSYYDLYHSDREKQSESFFFCFDPIGQGTGVCAGRDICACSLSEFLVGYAWTPSDMHEATPTLCVAIWCMRHGLAPFDGADIDWAELIAQDCGKNIIDQTTADFLVGALTSPLFGPADVKQFMF